MAFVRTSLSIHSGHEFVCLPECSNFLCALGASILVRHGSVDASGFQVLDVLQSPINQLLRSLHITDTGAKGIRHGVASLCIELLVLFRACDANQEGPLKLYCFRFLMRLCSLCGLDSVLILGLDLFQECEHTR